MYSLSIAIGFEPVAFLRRQIDLARGRRRPSRSREYYWARSWTAVASVDPSVPERYAGGYRVELGITFGIHPGATGCASCARVGIRAEATAEATPSRKNGAQHPLLLAAAIGQIYLRGDAVSAPPRLNAIVLSPFAPGELPPGPFLRAPRVQDVLDFVIAIAPEEGGGTAVYDLHFYRLIDLRHVSFRRSDDCTSTSSDTSYAAETLSDSKKCSRRDQPTTPRPLGGPIHTLSVRSHFEPRRNHHTHTCRSSLPASRAAELI